MPPCIVALIQQSKNAAGEPNGSISTNDPRFPFLEYPFRNTQASFSENSIFFKLFSVADSFAIFRAVGFRSLILTVSIFNSFATRNPLAPTPDNPSKKIFGPSNFFKNAAYAIIEISLLFLAFKLINAGFDVSLVARGEQLDAMRNKGLTLIEDEKQITCFPKCTDSIETLGKMDFIFITLKAYSIPGMTKDIAKMFKNKRDSFNS